MVTAPMKLKDICSYDKPRQHIKSRHITLPTKVCIVKATAFPRVMCRVKAEPQSAEKLMLLNCGAGEDSWESTGQQD